MKQVVPPSITGLEGAPAASVVDHRFGTGDPYTLGVEEEYMLLDPQSLDLVQHIETVLDAVEGDALADRINAELMQSVLEIATPVCTTAGDVMRELTTLRSYVRDVGREHGPARRLGGHASVQPVRAPADHGEGPLPRPDRPAPVRRAAGADLRDARSRRRRRPGQGDPGRERPSAAPRSASRALGELAVLAGRADGARVEQADRLLGLPPVGAAPALPRLRGLRRRRRAARAHGLHRGLHAHLVGHPPASQVGDDRDPHLRRRHAGRGRRRDRGVLPGARQAPLRALRRRRGDPEPPPHPDQREQVARGALRARRARDGPRDRPPDPHPAREARAPHLRDLEPHARELGSERELEGIEAILGRGNSAEASSACSTRTATSSRSSARSRTRRRRCPPPPPRPRASVARLRQGDGEGLRVDGREQAGRPGRRASERRGFTASCDAARGSSAPRPSTAGRCSARCASACRARG